MIRTFVYDKAGFQTDKPSREIENSLKNGDMMWVDLENPSEDELSSKHTPKARFSLDPRGE